MAEESQAPKPTRLQRARSAYSVVGDILTPGTLTLLLAAAALAVIGLVGGWEAATATTDDTPVVAAGTPQEVAPFEITVTSLRHGDELPGVVLPSDEHRYLFLVAEVTNASDAPVSFALLGRSVTLDVDGLDATPTGIVYPPEIYRINDSLPARTYPPGVATPSVLIWKVDKSLPVPDDVTVTLNAFTWRHSVVEQRESWFDESPAATMVLPVEPLAQS